MMPITYKEGLEFCSVLAFARQDLKDALDNLGDVAMVEIESQGPLVRHSARPAMTISIHDFFGSLTSRQLGALVDALDMGLQPAEESHAGRDCLEEENLPFNLRGAFWKS